MPELQPVRSQASTSTDSAVELFKGPDETPELTGRLPWMARGACRGAPTEWFFPECQGHRAAAEALCASCTVQGECRNYGLINPDLVGIWGGIDAHERNRLRTRTAVGVLARRSSVALSGYPRGPRVG